MWFATPRYKKQNNIKFKNDIIHYTIFIFYDKLFEKSKGLYKND